MAAERFESSILRLVHLHDTKLQKKLEVSRRTLASLRLENSRLRQQVFRERKRFDKQITTLRSEMLNQFNEIRKALATEFASRRRF